MAPLAGANEEKKIREDVCCKMASLKTSSDENACKMAPLAGAKLKSEKCGSENVCKKASLQRRGDEKKAKCGLETACLEALLERRGDEKSAECDSGTVCQEALLKRRGDNEKKIAVFGNGSIRFVNDYEGYDSDSGDIGLELGECEQIEKRSSDVIEI